MVDARGPSHLDEVLEVLRASTEPLKAREIAARIRAMYPGMGEAADLRQDVNRLLYGTLSAFVEKDPSDRWRLVRNPLVTPGHQAKGTSPVGFSTTSPDEDTPATEARPFVPNDVLGRVGAMLGPWKQDLIDFGKRNKVLYFNSGRRTKLRLTVPGPAELYEATVLRDKALAFGTPYRGDIDKAELEEDAAPSADVREKLGDIAVDYDASSAKDVRSLQRKLYRLHSDARTTLSELGINTLHLALGILRWREAESSKEWIESPILLVPAAIDREKNAPYRMSGFEGDVVVNPALRYRLRHDFTLELPSFEPYDGFGESANLIGFFDEVAGLVRSHGWTVLHDAWLSHFSFEKLVMFEDLSQPGTAEEIALHEVLGAICQVSELDQQAVGFEDLESSFELPDAFPVVDADSSQLEVIARVRGEQSLVVQGPPGTGKSQTIVNLIAQSIRDGKSVLFVSEKRAALDVVHRRLREVGLSDLCLELHSHRANKREVVRDLYLAMQGSLEAMSPPRVTGFQARRSLRKNLDAYVRALHERRGKGGRTAYEVHGVIARLQSVPLLRPELPGPRAIDLSQEEENRLVNAVETLVRTGIWDIRETHPWRESHFDDPAFVVQQSAMPHVAHLIDGLRDLTRAISALEALTNIPVQTSTLADMDRLISLARTLASIPESLPPRWLFAAPGEFAIIGERLAATSKELATCETLAAELDQQDAGGLSGNAALVIALANRYREAYGGFWARLTTNYRADKRSLRSVLGRKASYARALPLLSRAKDYHDSQARLARYSIESLQVTGITQPANSDQADVIEAAFSWSSTCRRLLPNGAADAGLAVLLVNQRERILTEAPTLAAALEQATNESLAHLPAIDALFPAGLNGASLGSVPIEELAERAEEWKSAPAGIIEWADYFHAYDASVAQGLEMFLKAAQSEGIRSEELVPALRKALATRWLIEVYQEVKVLGQFSATAYEDAIQKFRQFDKDLQTDARQGVRHAANVRQEPVREAAALLNPGKGNWKIPDRTTRDELKRVQREYQKKTRHLPLRRLLPQLPTVLPAVKPCLLMSPLSVASYLPRNLFKFDIVIFDEASQILPADAVGAILRGKQLVVLGDSKQLPPTRFFQRGLEDDEDLLDDEEADIAADARAFDSILEVSAAALPQTGLRWHYRSRDERLIAFSNKVFYSERPLITFPTPLLDGDTGVRFVHISDGLYGLDGSRTNPVEARAIVDLVIEHFRRYGWDRTLGVIALSISQRDVIELELRRRLLEEPDLESYLAESGPEPFFIKNLETVQGDERDSIILGIGYGASRPGGLPAMRFGPVNARGGERRLNVAVTRAKFALTLVSSMRPEQLDRARHLANAGPQVMADYFGYVERGGRFETEGQPDSAAEPESAFEEAVLEAMRRRGYQVDPQVGTSGFRIDLAVRHPDIPSRYIVGIECDGAAYHSAVTARDRDRLRQEMLEDQGWTIHRVWSTDWIQHPDDAVAAIVEQIEAKRAASETGVRVVEADQLARIETLIEPEELPPLPSREAAPLPSVLPAPFLDEQREALQFELGRVERQVSTMRQAHVLQHDQSDKGFADDQLESSMAHRLERIRSALKRIEAGTYGLCERCRGPIEIERLEAVPYTSLCRGCAQAS